MMGDRQYNLTAELVQQIFGDGAPSIWLAKLLGAVAGSLVSIAYVLPRGRREAILRFVVGVAVGLIFGGTAGLKLADIMGLLGKISTFEITLMGATIASAGAWWGLGAYQRLARRWSGLPSTKIAKKIS